MNKLTKFMNNYWYLFVIWGFVFVFYFSSSVFAYTTEQTLVFNKIASSSNLTEQQTLTLFEYLEKQQDKISNETGLIEEVREDLEEIIETNQENQSEEFDLIYRELDTIHKNITTLHEILNEEKETQSMGDTWKQNLERAKERQMYCQECQSNKAFMPNIDCSYFCVSPKQESNNNTQYLSINDFKDNSFKYDDKAQKYYLDIKNPKDYDKEIEELQDKKDTYFYWLVGLSIILALLIYKTISNNNSYKNNDEIEDVNIALQSKSKKEK